MFILALGTNNIMDNFFKHPIKQIQTFIDNNSILENSHFHYSMVEYDYKTKTYNRKNFAITGKTLSIEWLTRIINELPSNWELSFHSVIQLPDESVMHIPMIDFNIENLSAMSLEIIRERFYHQKELIKFESVVEQMIIYESGRSYHGYSSILLEPAEWVRFMTSMILLNFIKELNANSLIVDERWIAHRLLEGYGSLRWSANSKKSLQYASLKEGLSLI